MDGTNWYLWILAQDEAGNTTLERSNVFYFDNTNPQISFTYNSSNSSEYATTHDVIVNVTDNSNRIETLKYVWTQTSVKPSESDFNIDFNNNQTITQSGVTGNWYYGFWQKMRQEIQQ